MVSSPCGNCNDIGFNFASVVKECTCFAKALKFQSALDSDLTIGDHGAGSEIWEMGQNPWFNSRH